MKLQRLFLSNLGVNKAYLKEPITGDEGMPAWRMSLGILLAVLSVTGCASSRQLHEAASYGDYRQAEFLIDTGARVNWRDFAGETARSSTACRDSSR